MRQPIVLRLLTRPLPSSWLASPIRNSKKPDSTSAINPWPTIPLPTGNRTDKITGNYKSHIFNRLLIYI
jgi:hypothetical protein